MNNFDELMEQYYGEPIDEGLGKTLAQGALGLGLAFSPIAGQADAKKEPQRIEQKVPKISSMQFINYMKKFIERNEGREYKVYNDTRGNPSVGVGFNLNRPGAEKTLAKLGLKKEDILNGQKLKDFQIDLLLTQDVAQAAKIANRFVKNYDELPNPAKIVLVDMSFNLGEGKLNEFKKLKAAIEKEDFDTAAKEMVNSNWFGQVGDRSKKLVRIMKGL